MVPEAHDYRSQEWNDHGRLLVRQPDGFYEMSNVCRHRQAIMLQGAGNAKNIVCPIHRWTYDAAGELIGAPHFPANPASISPGRSWRTGRACCSRGRARPMPTSPT